MVDAEQTVKKYYDDVYKFCCAKCRNPDDAQDITQDTFTVFTENFQNLEDDNIRAWLLKVANNKLHEYFRKISVEKTFVEIDEVRNISVTDSYNLNGYTYSEDELFDEVQRKILNLLNEKERDLFIRLYIEHKSIEIVSEELGLSVGTARTRKSRLKDKIKKSYEYSEMLILVICFKLLH